MHWPALCLTALLPFLLRAAPEDVASCRSAPSIPQGLTSPSQTTHSITLTWKAATAGPGCAITYRFFRDGVQVTQGLRGTTAIFYGLAAGTRYTFAVAAVDQAGQSARSRALQVWTQSKPTGCTGVPSVPTGLAATEVTAASVTLAWNPATAASGCAISYRVTRDGILAASGLTARTFTVSGLTPDTPYTFAVSAVDPAGASPESASIPVSTRPADPTALPRHILTGYWQNWNDPASGGALRIRDVPPVYDLIAVAFADATATRGAVAFNLDPSLGFTEAQFIADIALVKARGQHVILSVGGQNGAIAVNDAASAGAFASSLNTLMARFGFEGVDIDFENGLNATYLAQALRAIRPGSILTLAPQTLDMQTPTAEYFKLALSLKDILTVCNMQYYNSGSMYGYDGKIYQQGGVDFLTALATIQLEKGLRPDQVGLGLPATPSSAGSGFVPTSVVNDALDCLASGRNCGSFQPPRSYPALRGAMTWSINWDAANGYAFANAVKAKLNTLP